MNQSPFIIGVPGTELTLQQREVIKRIKPCGVILFSRNIKSPDQLKKLITDLYELIDRPLITIDQEGGRVARLRELGCEPPSAQELLKNGQSEDISLHGTLMGKLQKSFAINFDLCPVLDLSYNQDDHNSLKNRTWGENHQDVTKNSNLFNKALREQGVKSCGKHFPSYSQASIDPHHQIPEIPLTKKEMREIHWRPYQELKSELDAVMIGHAYYPDLDDSGVPSSLSPVIIEKYLREEIGFQGIITSDDMDMGAITENYGYEKAIAMALNAGNDLLLLCHQFNKLDEALRAYESLSEEKKIEKQIRIEKIKEGISKVPNISTNNFAQANEEVFQMLTRLMGESRAKSHSPENAARSPVEQY